MNPHFRRLNRLSNDGRDSEDLTKFMTCQVQVS
jgi:hypothetical protein